MHNTLKALVFIFFLGLLIMMVPGCGEETAAPVVEEEIVKSVSEQLNNQTGNLINGGLLAEKDDWIYYSNFNDGGKIYRVHADGGEHFKVNDDHSLKITIAGGWVYYLASEERSELNRTSLRDRVGGRIYKIRTDGSERTLLLDDYSWELLLVDDWIYHTRGGYGIYRFRTDGTGHQIISTEPASYFNLKGDWLYFCQGWQSHETTTGGIHKVSTDGGEIYRVGDETVYTLHIAGDWIYYSSLRPDRRIAKIRADGTEQSLIVDDWAFELNVAGDWIYYVNRGDEDSIYRIRTDGSERVKLNSDSSSNLTVIGDWLYYTLTERDEMQKIISEEIYRIRTDGSDRTRFDMAEPAPVDAAEEHYYVAVDEGNHLFMRSSYGSIDKDSSDVLDRLPRGRLLIITDRHNGSIIEDHFTWWEAYDPQSGITGWVASEYLRRELLDPGHYGEVVEVIDHPGQEQKGNTPGNLVNSGIAAGQDDWIYYTIMLFDEERQMSAGGETYKVRTNGSGLARINNYYSPYLNVVGDQIYYIDWFDFNTTNVIPRDGGDSLLINREYAAGLTVVDGWIYYLNHWDDEKIHNRDNRIFKIRTDGSENTKLNDNHSLYLNVVGDWIYYSNRDDAYILYKMRLDGSEQTKVNSDYTKYINVVDDWIYYCNGSDGFSIYRIRTDGSERTKLSDDVPGTLNVAGGWIYYSNQKDNYAIYKMRTDGSGRVQVNNEQSSSLNVVGDWIIYTGLGYYMIRTDGSQRQKLPE